MSQQQLVEKITHLENQLKQLESLEFGIRNTLEFKKFYEKRINHYSLQ